MAVLDNKHNYIILSKLKNREKRLTVGAFSPYVMSERYVESDVYAGVGAERDKLLAHLA